MIFLRTHFLWKSEDRSGILKKIFSKSTLNRRPEFQIETSILIESGEKRVCKRALTDAAKAHVNHMYQSYLNSPNRDRMCPAEQCRDGEVLFPFLSGVNLNELMVSSLQKRDKRAFEEYLQSFRKFVEDSCELCEKPETVVPQCKDAFGVENWAADGSYGMNLNIDLCFDNILRTEKGYIAIDYEWIFAFPLPVNFVIFRGINAFYIRYAEYLRGLYTWDELYSCMGLTGAEAVEFEKINQNFNDYVCGREHSYQELLDRYAVPTYEPGSFSEGAQGVLQVYADFGTGYSEENSCKSEYRAGSVRQEFDISSFGQAETLRIDPCHIPFLCRNLKIEIEDKFGRKHALKSEADNAWLLEGGVYVFVDDDPQILCRNYWKNRLKKVIISFDILKILQGEELELFRNVVRGERKAGQEKERLLLMKHSLERRLTETVQELMLKNM